MLDTNIVSAFMHGRSGQLDQKISTMTKPDLCISAISYGETRYGLTCQPAAYRLAAEKLFSLVDILDWSIRAADRYGELRTGMRRVGKSLQPLDMLIAAHALEAGATLVTNDRAFRFVPGLEVEDWTAE